MKKNATDQLILWALALHGEPDTLRSFARKTHELLTELRVTSSHFSDLAIITSKGLRETPRDAAALEEVLRTKTFGFDDFQDFSRLAEDGALRSESLSRIGFSTTYATRKVAEKEILAPESGGVRLSVQGVPAGAETSGQVILHLPCDRASEVHGLDTVRRLLAILVDKWKCSSGGVYARAYQRRVNALDRASYAGQWLYYLPLPSLARCLPPDIRCESFANGILIETTPHMPDVDDPADVAAGIRVRDVLDEFGLVNDATYAIHGWPPDEEESLYEQFISGAPPDRKYMVHCVSFDGYDTSRKVLLYAKLFRRLKRHPTEWGLRGWDGAVLNEARRQVRAAAKAGGVPIEWHIGLEEPAHQVRQLLADHTSITEDQLRVIYTPLEEALTRMQR
jgi:hypothetical protein